MIASEILSQTKIKKRSDIASCLLLTTILLEVSVIHKKIKSNNKVTFNG